jgi:beta-glucanase (GH16 family)
MKNFKISVILITTLLFMVACKKTSDASSQTVVSNLQINAVVSSDGSGKVDFTASATNALSYSFEFGNGIIQTSTTGIINYQYTTAGNNSYTVTVTANGSSSSAKATTTITVNVSTTAGASLYWSDEFNVDGAPDPNKWGYDLGAGGWGNSELEYYTNRSTNVIVSNGTLKITAIKENYSGSAYTSARILTKDKFVFTYGRVEMRAKLPAGVGTWPALWMLGSNAATAPWPSCGEIDIMEQRGSELNKIYGTLHYPGHSGANGNGNTEFHIYKLDWTPTAINIYVDDKLFQSVANSSSIPFNHDFFLIFNLAMGGSFAGAVDPAFTNATMEVDYIRIYK